MLGTAGELPETVQRPALREPAVLQVRTCCGLWAPPPPPRVPVRERQEAKCPHSSVLTPEVGSAAPQDLILLSFLSIADEAQEAEAIRILTSILSIRESTSDKAPQKTVFVLKILVMLYYLMMNSSKASFPRKAACLKWR